MQPANHQPSIFWLNGQPGSGKTTIARSVAKRCHDGGILGASFFCSRSDADCNNPSMIFTTIAYQLGLLFPSYSDRVSEILKKDPLLVYAAVTRQFEELIIQPLAHLHDLHNDGSPIPPCIVVIDALDECRGSKATSAILSNLLKHADKLPPLRFFITSRPEHHIVTSFDSPDYRNASSRLVLHEVELEAVTPDIKLYITASLLDIKVRFRLAGTWPGEGDIEILAKKAGGLFIFAATAVKFIEDRKYLNGPRRQLEILISAMASDGSYRLLDWLYSQVLETTFPDMPEDLLESELKSILGSIVTVQDPLPLSGLSRLIGLPADTVYSSLVGLHSVLIVPESEESKSNIRIIHPTFAEFLIDSTRCTNRSFTVNSQQQHTELLCGCLEALQELRRDICDIRDPSLLNTEVPNLLERVEKAIPPHVKYACRHWYTHLVNGNLSAENLEPLSELVERRLLYWVEACSVLGVLREAILGLSESQRKLRVMLLSDCERLIVGYFPAISGSALQLYHLIPLLVPRKTALAQIYAGECRAENSVKVFGGATDSWDACLGTVTAHEGQVVRAVDLSPDDRTIVSSGDDNKIRLWDALTCAQLLVLYGHSDFVRSVKYSPDGARIVSAADDGTVKIWDAVSGVLLCTLKGHTNWVLCAVYTPDGGRIVSGSRDNSIKIWDAETGACLMTLTEHRDRVTSIAVSPDGLWMASGADDMVCLWSLEAPEAQQVFAGHTRDVICVAYSQDGTRIASGSRDGTVRLWDTTQNAVNTPQLESAIKPSDPRALLVRGNDSIEVYKTDTWECAYKPLSLPSGCTHYAAFSPDDAMVLVASDGEPGRVALWDAASGSLCARWEGELYGHTNWVTSVAFAPGGDVIISSDRGNGMRLWDIATGACLLVLSPATWGSTVRLSPDGSGVLVDDDKRLIQLWAPLNEDALATTSLPWLPRRTWPIYYIEDSWIFSLTPTRQARLCWVPADWQGIAGFLGQDVLFGKQGARLNFSALSSYLESLHTAST
ncbi:uncharacterized protein PHACADRAFT_135622 [Phanerochaete carnosa HHB-10118-sp]|uniref:Nephrocystin 3-like N-terminal domain-containing protein n=1 Tax=Phanerochaete carnosa (strain HHB-10118-sp) TaxID=650164 RepID=K5XF61_PHACS|nr:uncharacterized protein PHACADRAFT_135622 [Phanerochaete carnosa HHB-10118-sp]EKM61727.1 hypothetical protein PHACADRAFT_135622 [Phanerochaete carnosa HHB-10118-sp]